MKNLFVLIPATVFVIGTAVPLFANEVATPPSEATTPPAETPGFQTAGLGQPPGLCPDALPGSTGPDYSQIQSEAQRRIEERKSGTR